MTNNNNELFSTTSNSSEPLAMVKKDYREHLLERALQCLIGIGIAKNDVKIKSDDSQNLSTSQISDVLSYTKLMTGCSKFKGGTKQKLHFSFDLNVQVQMIHCQHGGRIC